MRNRPACNRYCRQGTTPCTCQMCSMQGDHENELHLASTTPMNVYIPHTHCIHVTSGCTSVLYKSVAHMFVFMCKYLCHLLFCTDCQIDEEKNNTGDRGNAGCSHLTCNSAGFYFFFFIVRSLSDYFLEKKISMLAERSSK